MNAKEEKAYLDGKKSLAREILGIAYRELGHNETSAALPLSEVTVALDLLCRDLKIKVPKGLHPADVVEKYLRPHINELREPA